MTIRRDLRRLELDGLVRRVPGGAAQPSGHGSRSFGDRTIERHVEKRAIGRAAAELVDLSTSFALDAGTTVVEIARFLPPGVTVVTHSVPVMAACSEREDIDLIGLGGSYQPATRSFAGLATRAGVESLDVDVALLSAVAVGPGGLFCSNPLDAEIKQLLARAARRVVALVDHTKLGARAPLRFARLTEIDLLVVDDSVAATDLAWLRQGVREVVVAQARDRVPT